MHRLSLTHRRGAATVDAKKGDRQCFVRERISLSLSGWQKVLHLADEASPWPRALNPHTQTRLLSLEGRRTQSEGAR